jgi:hypothetical protein
MNSDTLTLGRCVRLTTLIPSCAVVKKSENLNFLEPSGPPQACNGTALPLLWPFKAQWLLYVLPNLTFRNYTFCPENEVMCSVRFCEQTTIISPIQHQLTGFYNWGLRFLRGTDWNQSVWDLWWTKWQWDRFMSEYFGFTPQFPSSSPPYHCFLNLFSSRTPFWFEK